MTRDSLWDTRDTVLNSRFRDTGMIAATVHYKRIESLRLRFLRSRSTRAQVARFLTVGVSCMLVDLLTYRGLLLVTSVITASKAAGFVVGTTTAFFANRAFTFKQQPPGGPAQLARFLALYAVTLLVNVGINSALLHLLGMGELGINTSFAIATLFSSALNFIGMKMFVFNAQISGATLPDSARSDHGHTHP